MMLLNVKRTKEAFSIKRITMTRSTSRMPRHAVLLFLCISVLSSSIPFCARQRWKGIADIMLNDVCSSRSSASFLFACAFAFAPHRLQQHQQPYRYNKQSVPFRIDTLTQTTITTTDPSPQHQFILHSLAAVRRPTTMAETSSSLFLLRNKNHNVGFHDDKRNHASTQMPLELRGSGDENGDYGTFESDADEMSGNIALITNADDDEESNDNNGMQTAETNKEERNKQQSTGDEIFSIAIPALAGLAIDPLMVCKKI